MSNAGLDVNQIHCDDYRNRIPDPGDCWIVTDPPYNVGIKYPNYRDNVGRDAYQALFEPMRGYRAVIINYPEIMIRDICPVLGIPERTVAWCYNSNTPRQWRMVAWFNCEPDLSLIKQPYKNQDDKRVLELIANGSEGGSLYDWWNVDMVKNVSSSQKMDYVNQIPEEIIRRILLTTVPVGGLVFEPFCGSGTTPIVARRFGYPYIATDISPKAVAVANQRLGSLEFPLLSGGGAA